MTEQEQIAEYLARKGATKCEPGIADAKSTRTTRNTQPTIQSEWEWEMGFQREALDRVRGR